jgi:lipopolysaccharide export system protein LptA
MNADTLTVAWDPKTRSLMSADAKGSVKFLYKAPGKEGRRSDIYSGACDTAAWKRETTSPDDLGVAVLQGNVMAKLESAEAKQVSEINCDRLTVYLNERRYIAEGGPERQVDLGTGGVKE